MTNRKRLIAVGIIVALAGGAFLLLRDAGKPEAVQDLERAQEEGAEAQSNSDRITARLEELADNLAAGGELTSQTDEIGELTARQRESLEDLVGILEGQLDALERSAGSLEGTESSTETVADLSQAQARLLQRAVAALRELEDAARELQRLLGRCRPSSEVRGTPRGGLSAGVRGRAMKKWIGVVLAGLALAGSLGMFVVSMQTRSDAKASLEGARQLYAARLQVAEAQKELGNSDLSDAVQSARSANAIAIEVGEATSKIVALLEDTDDAAANIAQAARRGTQGAVFTRRQSEIVGDALGAIAGYQNAASAFSKDTNRSLRRILVALRKTNEEFPGGAR